MNEYKVIRSNRRTVCIQVLENGEVVVRAPENYPEKKLKDFIFKNEKWIAQTQEKQINSFNTKVMLNSDQIKRLKEYAGIKINERVEFYSSLMNIKPTGVKITSAQKRFGSCNGKNSLCFSYILMLYPDEAVDYVVVHELSHIRHHNHSKDFYKLISSVLPDYKYRERLLKGKQKLPEFI